MKEYFILLFLGLSNLCLGQSFFVKHANEIKGFESFYDLFVIGEEILIVGSSMIETGVFKGKPHLHYYNITNGELVDEYFFFKEDTISYSFNHSLLAQNKIYSTGIIQNDGGTDNYDNLILIFKDNEVDTLIRFGNPEKFDRLYGVTLDNEQNIVTGGLIRKWNVSARSEITKFSSSYDLLWSRVIDPDTTSEYRITSITTDDENNIYCIADADFGLFSTIAMSISKYSPDGDSLWTKFYPIDGFSLSEEIKFTNDGNLLVSGGATLEKYGSMNRSPIFMKIDTSGEVIWLQDYQLEVGGHAYQSNSLLLEDGGFANVYSGFGYPTLLVADENGDELYTKHYDQFDVIFPRDLKRLDDGSFVMVGYINSNLDPEGHTMWLLKTDVDGNVTVSTLPTKGIGDIVVYPNPTSDFINVKTDILYSDILSYKIIDAMGRVIVSTNSSIIDVSNLTQGNYFVNVFSKGQLKEVLPFIKH